VNNTGQPEMLHPGHETGCAKSASTRFLGSVFDEGSTDPIYLCRLKNADNPEGGGPQHLFTRDLGKIDDFLRQHDKPGYGIYFCVSTLEQDATTRSKETLSELTGLHCDLDFKGILENEDQILDTLEQLPLRPTKIVRSGHGLHAYWLFSTVLPATIENIAKVDQLLRMLARQLAGDPAPAHAAALMRVPGSHNSKNGEWVPVEETAHNQDAQYRFDELFEWLKNSTPILTRKAKEKETADAGTNGGAGQDPFLDFAAAATGPIDVEARLAAMKYQGAGNSSIHITQLEVSASLLSRGVPIDEVVQTIFDATCAAAGAAGNSWSWSKERQSIEKMCFDWLAKHPEIVAREQPRQDDDPTGVKPEIGKARKADRGKKTLPLIAFRDITLLTASTYIVKGVIPRSGLVVIWGPPKCGKSFWTFDLVMHVALGRNYRGRRVSQGPVVYCAFEGAHGFRARVEAYRRANDIDRDADVPFYLSPLKFELVKRHKDLVAAIKVVLGDAIPVVIVLDTLNRSMTGSESKDEDMTAYLNAADTVREVFDCAVVIVHHCGVDGSRPRGHTSLTGAADSQLAVTRNEAGNIAATVEYLKDGPEGATFVSRLAWETLDYDDDGDEMTSCVVREVEEVAGSGTITKPKKSPTIPKTAQIALRALFEAVSECGEAAPASNHIPKGVKVATVERWRDYAYRMGISTGEARAQQKAFKSGSECLIAAEKVGVWGNYVWPVQGEPKRT
jgi:AAA domain